jgi:hypothetical protein
LVAPLKEYADDSLWLVDEGTGPLVATANHAGHELRGEIAALAALPDEVRLREEDPFTDAWTSVAPTRIRPKRSRFEVDLNRARHEAVYLKPEDAWGLQLWKSFLPADAVERSLAEHDAYYETLRSIFARKAAEHGAFFVFDLHSYNHLREGPGGPAADPAGNPEVNVGTGTMDRARWAPVVDRFIEDLGAFDFLGRRLDVRENVKFRGRELPRWTHTTFAESGCVIAVEFKKFFMDEWTGNLDRVQHDAIGQALASTVPGILDALAGLGARV